MQAEWLPIIMQGSISEIYVIDCDSLQFVAANRAACENLQYDEKGLLNKTLISIAKNMDADLLASYFSSLRSGEVNQITFDALHIRKDGSVYPIELKLLLCLASPVPAFIAIGNDVSARNASALALRLSETRYRAIVSNTPGVVFQCLLHADGSISFPYLSDGCQALLGISADYLRIDPERFLTLILPEDRSSYLASLNESASERKSLNWEGRIWVDDWKDIKWINLRASPRSLSDDMVQWEGIMTNISDSKKEKVEIRRSRAQLAELSAHGEKVKEQERTRIAREIHDDLGGNLTAIKMALALLSRRLPADDKTLLEKAEYVDSLVDRTIESIHRIAGDLRPSLLDFGLAPALAWQTKEFTVQSGIPCEFSSNQDDMNLPDDQANALFRIVQEALTNISKHAQASCVDVRLLRDAQNVHLEIEDDGKGMQLTDHQKPKSFGIRGMKERVRVLGGMISIKPGKQSGTLVAITIPLNTNGHAVPGLISGK